MTTPAARPRQVRLACTLAGFGAGFVLLNIFTVMASWPPAALRDELESLLAEPRFTDTRITADTVLAWLRVVLMAAAAGCVASIVLAVHTARRHRSARVVLSVLLPITALTSLSTGLPGLLLLAVTIPSVVLLWQRDAKAWFMTASERGGTSAGPVPPPPRVPASHAPKEHPPTMSTQPPEHEGPPSGQSYPGPTYPGSGQQGASHPGPSYPGPPAPPAYGQQYPQQYGQSYGGYGGDSVVPRQRPGSVTAAAIVTLVMSTLAALGALLVTLAYLFARDDFSDGIASNEAFSGPGVDADDIATVFFVLCLLIMVLASVAIFIAIRLLRGSAKGRVPLVVLSAITILIGILTLPLGLLWSAAAIAVIILCFTGGAGAWFDSRAYNADAARTQY